jgi:hypothetical protein
MDIVGHIWDIIGLAIIVVMAVTSWILRAQMRRRIRKTLGVEVKSEMELTSLQTWMAVKNAEEKNRGGKVG